MITIKTKKLQAALLATIKTSRQHVRAHSFVLIQPEKNKIVSTNEQVMLVQDITADADQIEAMKELGDFLIPEYELKAALKICKGENSTINNTYDSLSIESNGAQYGYTRTSQEKSMRFYNWERVIPISLSGEPSQPKLDNMVLISKINHLINPSKNLNTHPTHYIHHNGEGSFIVTFGCVDAYAVVAPVIWSNSRDDQGRRIEPIVPDFVSNLVEQTDQ